MRSNRNRDRHKDSRMSPDAIAADAQFMLHQLSLPIEPTDTIKARLHRAIRNSGLSPRKAVRIWYRHACTIAAHEYFALVEAINRHAEVIESAAERNKKILQQLREPQGMRGSQYALAIDQETRPGNLAVGQEHVPTD